MTLPLPESPYTPPTADLGLGAVPLTPLGFTAAVFANPQLIALIVLTHFPVNVAIESYVATLDPDDVAGAFRAATLPAAILHPLFVGVTLEACRRFELGERASMRDLLTAGVGAWRRIFVAAWMAGLITVLGTLAFVIPGIWLALRYSLVEVATFRTKCSAGAARTISSDRARGNYWKLLGAHATLLIALVPAIAVSMAAAVWFDDSEPPLVTAVSDTLIDLFDLARFAGFWAIYRAAEPTETPSVPAVP